MPGTGGKTTKKTDIVPFFVGPILWKRKRRQSTDSCQGDDEC